MVIFRAGSALGTLFTVSFLTTTSVAQNPKHLTGFPPCDALIASGLGEHVLTASSPAYEPRVNSYFSVNARHHPWCILMPQTTQDVSTAISTLSKAGAGAGDWHIAVRSGGHGNPGSNNLVNGVTIDLGHMNHSWYDPSSNIASIQPGARWADVYANLLSNHNVTVTGGRDGDVGVGGFLLGGGISYHTGTNGFGCDTVLNYEAVLANGTIVSANATSHADIFKALKGGGSNFGVVTRFDVEATPAVDLAYGKAIISMDHSASVIENLVAFTEAAPRNPHDHLITLYTYTPETRSPLIVSIGVNTRGGLNSSAFSGVRKIPALSSSWEKMSLAAAANASQVTSGYRTSSATLTLLPSPSLLTLASTLHTSLIATLTAHLGPTAFLATSLFQPLPTSYAALSRLRGDNVLGLSDVRANAVLWTGGIGVTGDDAALAVAEGVFLEKVAELRGAAEREGKLVGWVYMNYGHAGQDVLGGYGEGNLEFLRGVSGRYDAGGFWQRRVPGGFKLGRAGG